MIRLSSVAAALLLTAAPASAQVAAEPWITDLNSPVRLVAPPGDSRLFVVERGGRVLAFTSAGAFIDTFLDVNSLTTESSERGLLGLAFPPDYAATGRFYVSYTDLDGDSRLARYVVGTDPDRADRASGTILLTVAQPAGNHNGGHIEFGPDGMLYFGLGDGGGSGDPQNNAQNDQTLLGKLLRLDVSGPGGYTIPPDNPQVGRPPLDEIWAKGLRNPWCWSFDRLTGDLYIADVGQNELEEINVRPAGMPGGANYGWRLMEGTACYEPEAGCFRPGLTLPVHEYTHGGSPFRCSISGGYVYRGADIPQLKGQYFYADFCSAEVWSLTWTGAEGATRVRNWTDRLAPAGGFGSIVGFGQDAAGELYVLDYDKGTAYRLVPNASAVPPAGPLRLNQNTPNPFNPLTTIAWSGDPQAGPVSLRVYDLAGRLVRTLADGRETAGSATWDGTDDLGRSVAAGVYHYRVQQGTEAVARKMVLLE